MTNTWILASEDRQWHALRPRSEQAHCGKAYLSIAAKRAPSVEHLACTGYELCVACVFAAPALSADPDKLPELVPACDTPATPTESQDMLPLETAFLAFDVLLVASLNDEVKAKMYRAAATKSLIRKMACAVGMHIWGLSRCPACRRPDHVLRLEITRIVDTMERESQLDMLTKARAALVTSFMDHLHKSTDASLLLMELLTDEDRDLLAGGV